MDRRWTDAEDARLKHWRETASTYDEIAAGLAGEGIEATPQSVRGRLRRLGLGSDAASRPLREDAIPASVESSRFRRVIVPVRSGDRWIVLNDTQFPFHDAPALAAVSRFMDDFDPHVIVLNGDIFDFYELSDFDKNPRRAFTLQDEIDVGRKVIDRWADRHNRAKRLLILGNHEDRMRRQLWRNPRFASLRDLDMQNLISPDQAWEILPYGSQAQILHMLVEHGDRVAAKGGYSAWGMFLKRGMSGIMGHTHRMARIEHTDERAEHRLFYIENGCLCSLEPEYAPYPNWQHGFTYGFINNGSVHAHTVDILSDGFREEGHWYRRG